MTYFETEKLLALPKFIHSKGVRQNQFYINIHTQFEYRAHIQTIDDGEIINFLLNIQRSKKFTLKISLHFQENNEYKCLMRVDYNGTHTNPVEINEFVPDELKEFAGLIINGSHIHYNIEGYREAQWARPIEVCDFSPKDISGLNFDINFVEAIINFSKKINLQTPIVFGKEQRLFQ